MFVYVSGQGYPSAHLQFFYVNSRFVHVPRLCKLIVALHRRENIAGEEIATANRVRHAANNPVFVLNFLCRVEVYSCGKVPILLHFL